MSATKQGKTEAKADDTRGDEKTTVMQIPGTGPIKSLVGVGSGEGVHFEAAAIVDFAGLLRKGGYYTESFRSIFVPHNVWATGAPSLWAQGLTGQGSLIAIIDSGVDDSHPDLKGKFVHRFDYVNDGRLPSKYNTHGTHVAGTILADGKIRGVAPGAKFIDFRVLGVNGSGYTSHITAAIHQAVKENCTIINMSLGSSVPDNNLHVAIQKAVKAGILVVCAVGNERKRDAAEGDIEISYPGAYPEVVGVGAVDLDGNSLITAYFSNQNKEVDVCAVGWRVLSTYPNGEYEAIDGTSMATPTVVGFAALIAEKATIANNGKPVTDEQARYVTLKSFTVDVFERGHDFASGAGFVSAYPAIPKRDNIGNWFIPIKPGQPSA